MYCDNMQIKIENTLLISVVFSYFSEDLVVLLIQ